MQPETQRRLLEINREFYKTFASSFSDTRGRVQPGVAELARRMTGSGSVLDVGCGNGTLARALAEGGFSGHYLGLDMSAGLLRDAVRALGQPENGSFAFVQVDLAQPGWAAGLARDHFDWVVSFAVFHHLPGADLRRRTAAALADLAAGDGRVAVSVWQWQNSPRLRERVLSWSRAGLEDAALDPGDALLDWRGADQVGLRYVHTFDETELAGLAESVGMRVVESFYSDGKPGNLALYQVWA